MNNLAVLTACAVAAAVLLTPAASQAQTACYTAWSATTTYTAGLTGSYNNVNYVANWWTLNQNPSTNNGGSGSGQPWTSQGACGTGTCTAVTAAPTVLTASGTTSTGTTLAWTAPSAPAKCSITSYTVYKSGTALATVTSGTSYIVTGLTASTTYKFTVAATDGAGTSAQTAAVSVTTLPATNCTTKPAAPTGLAATGTTATGTTLSWTANTAPTNCTIASYTVNKGGTSIGTATGTSFAVTGLTASTMYSFTVAATDAAGASPQSTALSVTASPAPSCTIKPAAPTGLAATGTASTSTTLNWTADTAPTNCTIASYTVYEGGTSIGTAAGTSFAVSDLIASTNYSFTVAASDVAGASPQSTALSLTTPPTGGGGGGGNGHYLIGYWHDFDNGSVDITLAQSSSNFDVMEVAFGGTDTDTSTILFSVYSVETQAQFIADIAALHGEGKKVILSIGGETGNVALNTATDISNFVTSVSGLMTQYGFDGIDIDIENNSFTMGASDTDYRVPKTATTINMINALHQLKAKFPNFILTFAPQLDDVQGGAAAYAGPWGDYLPLIYACLDLNPVVMVQDYNTGGVTALDGNIYNGGTADFHTAMTEMLLYGFKLGNGQTFPALAPSQVAFGVPASPSAASSGFTAPSAVLESLEYLRNGKSYGGKYILRNPAGYPSLRGLMTWSINWDQVNGYALSDAVAPYLHSLTPAIPAP
jgi:chitinase